MDASESINELADALAQAQGEFQPVTRDKAARIKTRTGGEYSYKFADLAAVVAMVRPILSKYGLAVAQLPGEVLFVSGPQGLLTVTTMLVHKSGQWIRGQVQLPFNDMDPRSLGGVITYARRYGLSAILGLVTEDDDDAGVANTYGKRADEPRAGASYDRPRAPASRPSNGLPTIVDGDEIPF